MGQEPEGAAGCQPLCGPSLQSQQVALLRSPRSQPLSVRHLAAAAKMLAQTHWGHNGNSKKQTRYSASERCN